MNDSGDYISRFSRGSGNDDETRKKDYTAKQQISLEIMLTYGYATLQQYIRLTEVFISPDHDALFIQFSNRGFAIQGQNLGAYWEKLRNHELEKIEPTKDKKAVPAGGAIIDAVYMVDIAEVTKYLETSINTPATHDNDGDDSSRTFQ